MVAEFDRIDMTDEQKPRIGLVGEIYVKFHPIANNHIVKMIEEEGGEIIVSGLADFFFYGLLDDQFRHRYLSGSWWSSFKSKSFVKLLEWYRKPYREAVKRAATSILSPLSMTLPMKRRNSCLSAMKLVKDGSLQAI